MSLLVRLQERSGVARRFIRDSDMSIIDKIEKFGKKAEIWSKSLYKNPTYWKFMFTLFALGMLLRGMIHLGWLT